MQCWLDSWRPLFTPEFLGPWDNICQIQESQGHVSQAVFGRVSCSPGLPQTGYVTDDYEPLPLLSVGITGVLCPVSD